GRAGQYFAGVEGLGQAAPPFFMLAASLIWPTSRNHANRRIVSTMASQGEIVVGLDIGTTKVCAVVGEIAEDGITILGVGSVPCRGLRKGIVSNIDWTVRSIKDAIEAAQTMAGVEIRTVYAGVAGSHIRAQASDGVAAIAGGEVTRADVERVLEGARAIPVDADRQILHRSEEHTSELQSLTNLVCRLLLDKKK